MKQWLLLLSIALACFLTRMPQLLGPHLFLDGDECLVGVMAKHIYDGKDFPLFFWGQQYGFTLIECLVIVPFYAVLGMTALAVKLAMLSLWTVGVLFLFKTLRLLNKGHQLLPFLLTLVFIFLPAWAIWSMKARGGYLTAFTLSNITLYLSFHPGYNKKIVSWILIGVLLQLIYQSNLLWLCGVLPIVVYNIRRNRPGFIALLASFIIFFVSFEIYKRYLVVVYSASIAVPNNSEIWLYLKRIPDYVFVAFHGNYYFSFVSDPHLSARILARVCYYILLLLTLVGLYLLLFRRKGNGLYIVSLLFVPACLLYTLFSREIQGRYLLPLTGFIMISLQLLLNKVRATKPVFIATTALIVTGGIAMFSFRNFEFIPSRKNTILRTVDVLKANKVHFVFCTDCMIPWQINFYSQETITARMPYIPERYPPNGELVNKAFAEKRKVAIMYYASQEEKIETPHTVSINDFGIGIDPTENDLKRFFYFPDMPPPTDL